MPFVNDPFGRRVEVHAEGTLVRWAITGEWIIYRMGNNTGNHMTVVAASPLYLVHVGSVYDSRGTGIYPECRVANEECSVVEPCDCPRHVGEAVFHANR